MTMTTTLEPIRVSRRKTLRVPAALKAARLHPRAAAVELQPEFRSLARQLCPRDKSTQDDLVQEMSLAVLLTREPQTASTFRLVATWRATDYLRWWRNETRRAEETATDELAQTEAAPPGSPQLDRCCDALNTLLGQIDSPF